MNFAFNSGINHFRNAQAVFRVHRHTVEVGEEFNRLFVFHPLIAGISVRQGSHIAGSLHVVLAAQRIDAGIFEADMAGNQCQIGQIHNIGGACGVLCNTQGVVNTGFCCLSIHSGCFIEVLF